MPNPIEVESVSQFQALLSEDLNRVSLINFWAKWASSCEQMNDVVKKIANDLPQLLVLQVEAEEHEDISGSFDIESVPTFFILRGHTLLGRINGVDPDGLAKAIAKNTAPTYTPKSTTSEAPAAAPASTGVGESESEEQLNQRMRGLMNQSNVVLFMKGNPTTPRCGFSKQTVALLNEQNIEFTHFDILTDESVRQGLKKLNNWPTFPQVIVKGELVGGLDIIKEMVESNELKELVAAA